MSAVAKKIKKLILQLEKENFFHVFYVPVGSIDCYEHFRLYSWSRESIQMFSKN